MSTTETESADLRRLRSGRDWYGYLTLENFEAVASRISRLLYGRSYTFIACNEGLRDYFPEVRTGQRLVEGVSPKLLSPDHGHITVADTYGVWGFSTTVADQPAARALRNAATDRDERDKTLTYMHIKRDRVEAEFHVIAGYRVYWVAAVEPDDG